MIQKREILPRVPLYYSVPMLAVCIVALIILIFLFSIEYPELLLQPVPSNAINVSSCGILSQNNAYYLVNQTLNASGFTQINYGGCLLVNASNAIIDGNGQNVVGSSGLAYNVMNLTGDNNTVKGFNVSDVPSSILRNGIISYGINNQIFNNQFSNASEFAIYSKGRNPPNEFATGNSIYNNTILDSNFGVFLHHTNYSYVYNNFIRSSNTSSVGIYLLNAYRNELYSNLIRDTNHSILLWVSDENLLYNNMIYTPMYAGIGSISSELNTVIRTNITSPQKNGVYLFPKYYSNISNPNIELVDVNVLNGNPSFYDFEVIYSSGAILFNHSASFVGGYFARYKLNGTHLAYSDINRASKVFFNVPLIASGNNLTDHVRTGFNFAEVKSNLNSELNRSATITFTGLPTNFVNPVIFRDGVACPTNICNAITSLNAGNVVINVTGWTNYSINGVVAQIPLIVDINEPSSNEIYLTSAFPVIFNVSLNIPGSAKFTLDNGLTNTTMNTINNRDFTYSQSSLSVGNYNFTVYTNSTTGFNVTASVNFSVGNQASSSQTLSIDEPDSNEQYTTAAFPVTFRVILGTINGSVKFSLNNGSTNITMINDSSGVEFEHVQSSLSQGNYTFIAYANFTNGTRITGRTNFSVVNTTGSSTGSGSSGGSSGGSGGSGGSSGGSSGGGVAGAVGGSTGSTGSPFNSSTFGTTTGGTGNTQTLNSQSGSSTAVRNMVYWLLIAILSIMIVILSLLIIKAIKQRKSALSMMAGSGIVKNNVNAGGLVSNLR